MTAVYKGGPERVDPNSPSTIFKTVGTMQKWFGDPLYVTLQLHLGENTILTIFV